MWSSDYPHNESTFGYSEKSLADGRRRGRARGRGEDRQHQHQELPGRRNDDVRGRTVPPSRFPELPDTRADVPRMRRPAARLDEGQGRRRAGPARQRQRGVRHRRQLAAARRRAVARRAPGGRSCSPTTSIRTCSCRSARARRPSRSCRPTTCTGRSTSNSTRASSISRRCWPSWCPPVPSVAVDELTGAMRRAAGTAVPGGSAVGRRTGGRPGEAGQDARPDLVHPQGVPDHRSRPWSDVQKALAPGVRQIDLSAAFVRRAFELGATANMLEAIWQVMPTTKTSGGVWTTTGDLALPLLTTERELATRRRAVDRRQHHLQRLLLGLRPHLAGRRRAVRPTARAVREVARDHRRRACGDQGRCHLW